MQRPQQHFLAKREAGAPPCPGTQKKSTAFRSIRERQHARSGQSPRAAASPPPQRRPPYPVSCPSLTTSSRCPGNALRSSSTLPSARAAAAATSFASSPAHPRRSSTGRSASHSTSMRRKAESQIPMPTPPRNRRGQSRDATARRRSSHGHVHLGRHPIRIPRTRYATKHRAWCPQDSQPKASLCGVHPPASPMARLRTGIPN